MTLQTLVSAVQQNMDIIAETMNLESDAIVINQCDKNDYSEYDYNGNKICCFSFNERGVGLSRNNALLRSSADIILFSDEDIRYSKGYAQTILNEFEKRPDADMLLFNFDVVEERRTYNIENETRVTKLNCGRYPTYSIAVRRESVIKANITFNLLFGGGAKYSCGEDSLFIFECIKSGMKAYALPISLGSEEPRPSTWFKGYNEKFFFDRGALYVPLYGCMAKPLALRWLFAHQGLFFKNNQEVVNVKQAYNLMKQGMKEYLR